MSIKSQSGQSLIEYLIIVAIVAVGSISVMRVVGHSVSSKFSQVSKALGANVQGNIETAQVRKAHYSKKSMRNFMSGMGAKDDGTASSDEE